VLLKCSWFEPDDCTRLATRLWDPLADPEEAVAACFTPLHVAAARARSDFIAVFLSQEPDLAKRSINAESANGSTPLTVAGSRAADSRTPVQSADCAEILIAAGAKWGLPLPKSFNALHAAAATGSLDPTRRLILHLLGRFRI